MYQHHQRTSYDNQYSIAGGQSEIGAYTIPAGYRGYLVQKEVHTDSAKPANIFFFHRENADDVTAPYSGTFRIVQHETGVSGEAGNKFTYPRGAHIGPCDIGYMGVMGVGTSYVSCEFTVLLVQDGY